MCDSKMKIAVVGNHHPDHRGGVESFTTNLCAGLARLGDDVRLVCTGGSDSSGQEEDSSYEIKRLPTLQLGGFPIPLAFSQAIPSNVDIVHATMPSPAGVLLAALWCKLHSKPLVVSIHSFPTRGGPVVALYTRRLLPLVLRDASLVIAPSQSFIQRSPLAEYFALNRNRTAVIPNGVNLTIFHPDPSRGRAFRTKHGLRGQIVIFVSVLDRSHWFKGLDYLLRAMRLTLDGLDLHLLVVGDGDRRPFYEKIASQMGLDQRVTFLGAATDQELVDAYNASTCLVLPSVSDTESFGIVLAEAMACGLPVIASDVGGLRDTVGNAGSLVPPRDINRLSMEINTILSTPTIGTEMSSRGLARAKSEFSWHTLAGLHHRLYLDVLTRARHQSS
jgi:glycosyltransferase involved in cell wall biosynthesis